MNDLNKDMKSDAQARMKVYGAKTLGSFKNGRILHNEAAHPDHANFDTVDHMRAAAIHSKMAADMEQGKQYLEAAHHRKQAANHRNTWKSMAKQPGSLYKSMMSATRTLKKEEKKPTIEVVPHPEEVIDVDPEVIENMNRRLGNHPTSDNPTENGARLLHLVRKYLSGPRKEHTPMEADDPFKAKLAAIIKKPLDKAQYVPHEIPSPKALPADPKPESEVGKPKVK